MNPVTRFICIKSMWYIRWIGSFIKHNLKQRKTLITIYFTNNILCTYLYIITWIKNEKNATTTFSHHQCWVYIWNCSKKCCIDSNLSIFIHFFFHLFVTSNFLRTPFKSMAKLYRTMNNSEFQFYTFLIIQLLKKVHFSFHMTITRITYVQ